MKVKDLDCQLDDIRYFDLDKQEFIQKIDDNHLSSEYDDYEIVQISADIDRSFRSFVLIDISKLGYATDEESE